MDKNLPAPAKNQEPGTRQPGSSVHQYCLGLGSNISPEENLAKAVEKLCQMVTLEAVSTAWETPAVGSYGPDFLNAAVLLRSSLTSEALKSQVIRQIEVELGRVRTENKNAPRTIDIDILLIDDRVIDQDLWSQAYLAVPVAELLPDFAPEESGETLAHAAQRLVCTTSIKPRPEVLPGSYMGQIPGPCS